MSFATRVREELAHLPRAAACCPNPEATLGELGALLDPPVGKSAVHRRLQRLLALAEADELPEDAEPAGRPGGHLGRVVRDRSSGDPR